MNTKCGVKTPSSQKERKEGGKERKGKRGKGKEKENFYLYNYTVSILVSVLNILVLNVAFDHLIVEISSPLFQNQNENLKFNLVGNKRTIFYTK